MNNTSINKDKKRKSNWRKKKAKLGNPHRPGSESNAPSRSTRNKRNNKPNRQGRPKQGPSKLNPELLIHKAVQLEVKDFRANRQFDDLPLNTRLKQNLKHKGYERPSEIQDKTLDILLKGQDILGIAQTGTGKTGAFLIPIIEQLIDQKRNNHAIVVVPTRELAVQVEEEFKTMTKGLGLYSQVFIGGTNVNKDIKALRRSINVVIGTPGRLLDLADRRALDLRKINTLVLDEFDRMLDMGFIHDVKRIIAEMKQRKQTMLFSATLDKKQQSLIDLILNNPEVVKVSSGEATSDHIDQDIIRLNPGENKLKLLQTMLAHEDYQKVLIFDEAKHRVNRLCDKLKKAGFKADCIHGNKTQNARQNALEAFKRGKVNVLVATDVAARGIDVSDVTHVINYVIPMTFDSYIHRIGRTGRAGKIGKAFTFVD
ncbi:MAG: RNA helicase [Crocinitomicaceae bacterium]|nr:RNA helicase [Crocinitomicaceae bacterium]|tara:strand:+ start:1430 stop:2710 length:1281 start_codon:yes stop_codon:yes gene_type:complete